jgi:carbon storage regulator
MLVLTRRVDESLVIDDHIVITILGIEGDKVKIGISAPREVHVLRKELWQALREQEQIARQLAEQPPGESFEALRQFLADQSGAGETEIEGGEEDQPQD